MSRRARTRESATEAKHYRPMPDYEPIVACPKCGSEDVTVTAEQMFMANTGDHYCHSVKTQDDNAKATCLDCRWKGARLNLVSDTLPG